jgi:hypothetical protein
MSELPNYHLDGIGVFAIGKLLIDHVQGRDRNDKCDNRSHLDRANSLKASDHQHQPRPSQQTMAAAAIYAQRFRRTLVEVILR